MYELTVPVQNKYFKRGGREKYVEAFRKMGVKRVLLAVGTYETDEEKRESMFSGKKLPAVITGHPDLYVMCKEKDGALSVGLWNFHADKINKPVIKLDKKYSSIRFAKCEGELDGDTVTLSKLGAYEYAFFEVR